MWFWPISELGSSDYTVKSAIFIVSVFLVFFALNNCIVCHTGCLKKTSFCEKWLWEILLPIMRNPPSFFLTDIGDSFCSSYIYWVTGITILGKWILISVSWATEDNNKLEEQQQICHMYPHIYLTSEKAFIFYVYLQKFNMDFSLSTVIFATANFHKRKFFLAPCRYA